MDKITDIFFGRHKELEILKGLAHDACAGNAESILISGCRGIGKTALMKHLYNYLFYEQEETIPFYYSISPSVTDVTRFSEDYLVKFIQQIFAFLRKDPDILRKGILLLEDMRVISRRLDEQWATEIIEDFLHVRDSHDPVKTFISAVTAPLRVCQYVKMPIIVLIDDFHEIRGIDTKDLWLQFEEPLRYPYTPHIFTGTQSLLNKMFFYETSSGKYLRLINIKGLDREDSMKLFISLCDAYRINVDAECDVVLDRLRGNPSYIRALVHSIRKTEDTITDNRLMEVYYNEIRDGAIFTYWTSHLKRYIPLHLREASLRLLYHLCNINTGASLSDMANLSFIRKEELSDIIEFLQTADVLQEGFSTFRLLDDAVLADVIKETYHREVLKETVAVKTERHDKEESVIRSDPPSPYPFPLISLIIVVIIAVIIYMNIHRVSEEPFIPAVRETISFPYFHDDAIERTLKTDWRHTFPTFRDEAIAFSKMLQY